MDLTAAYLALAAFAIFLAHAIVTRVGRQRSPLRRLALWHLLFSLPYLAASFLVGEISRADRLIGFFIYAALQYPFLFLVVGQAIRGFSLNICVSALKQGGSLSAADVFRSYGDNKGVEYVKDDRIRVMLECRAVTERNGKLELTRFGRLAVFGNRLFLQLFGLAYLGKAAGGAE